ncbi:MAG: 4Fe-4S binding protein [Candidatus Baldrarchaeia archaeon]
MPVPGALEKELLNHISKKPATEMYPFVKVEVPEGYRGKIEFNIEKCIGCGLCSRECPAGAIEMVEDERTKLKKRPKFIYSRCLYCAQCEESCPREAIKLTQEFELADYDKERMVIDA